MDFLLEGTPCTESEFANRFTTEWSILKHYHGDLTLHGDGPILSLENSVGSPLNIPIKSKLEYHQRFFCKHSKYKEPLAKAIGLKRGGGMVRVVDATAGMLGDSLLMLAMGAEVNCIERNPVVAALGFNALKQMGLENKFHFGAVVNFSDLVESADVVFYDPMFQSPSSKTVPKKAMQIFRDMVGKDEDALEVAAWLKAKSKRLVIKRGVKSPQLIEKCSMTFTGKAVAYDVYLRYIQN